jgi:hypothetical protein
MWLPDAVRAAALLSLVTLADVIWAALDLPHLRTYGVAQGASHRASPRRSVRVADRCARNADSNTRDLKLTQ